MVKSFIPPLLPERHKGQAGKVAIIGGSKEYCGAPYFAAYTALRMGADLSYVFCSQEAAPVIKAFSPDLIVIPVLDHPSSVSEISQYLNRMDSLIIGPGLGRNADILQNVKQVIDEAKRRNIPIVIDADGLFLVSQHPDIVQNYKKVILTPNVVEYGRLHQAVFGCSPDSEDPQDNLRKLCQAMGNVTIVRKGLEDIISDGNNVLVCDSEGSLRRCGGQGDLLSGSMGLFNLWAHRAAGTRESSYLETYGPTLAAAYGACLFTRECSRLAFEVTGRCMVTADMISEIPRAFRLLFE
ncbi:ATP-dependent (S)-NAD(P)H-hydrate dehydratase-like isoform X2 [Lineus longissimus]